MPSGKTHDFITLSLTLPTAVVAWLLSGQIGIAVVATVAMLFGGLMFGPDLDLHSVQYSRWGFLRVLWWPYRVFFKHRSRLTHGLVFGTAIRVIYFSVVLIVVAAIGIYLHDMYLLGIPASGTKELQRAAQS